jgi:hypothetical protein
MEPSAPLPVTHSAFIGRDDPISQLLSEACDGVYPPSRPGDDVFALEFGSKYCVEEVFERRGIACRLVEHKAEVPEESGENPPHSYQKISCIKDQASPTGTEGDAKGFLASLKRKREKKMEERALAKQDEEYKEFQAALTAKACEIVHEKIDRCVRLTPSWAGLQLNRVTAGLQPGTCSFVMMKNTFEPCRNLKLTSYDEEIKGKAVSCQPNLEDGVLSVECHEILPEK